MNNLPIDVLNIIVLMSNESLASLAQVDRRMAGIVRVLAPRLSFIRAKERFPTIISIKPRYSHIISFKLIVCNDRISFSYLSNKWITIYDDRTRPVTVKCIDIETNALAKGLSGYVHIEEAINELLALCAETEDRKQWIRTLCKERSEHQEQTLDTNN